MSKKREMKINVLVVDDEKDIVDLIKYNLDKENEFDVITAYDGRDALEKAAEKKPDVILLDIMMPEVNGFDVCKKLKAEKETSSRKIQAVTALGGNRSRKI